MAATQKLKVAEAELPADDSSEAAEIRKLAEVKTNNRLSIEIEFRNGDGETVTRTLNFRPLTLVPLGILRRTRRDPQEQMWAIFEWALPPEDLDVLDEIASDKLDVLLAGMQKASGTELGES